MGHRHAGIALKTVITAEVAPAVPPSPQVTVEAPLAPAASPAVASPAAVASRPVRAPQLDENRIGTIEIKFRMRMCVWV